MSNLKFNWELNITSVLTLATLLVGGGITYASVTSRLDTLAERVAAQERRLDPAGQLQEHAVRIKALEDRAITGRAERIDFQNDVMAVLTIIREDIAALKALQQGRTPTRSEFAPANRAP